MKQYGEKIAKLRKQNNLTQAELGKKLNVSYQAVSKWENNQSQPDLDTIQKLAAIFGITMSEFLEDEKPSKQTHTATKSKNNKVWILISLLAASIISMLLVSIFVPVKLSNSEIYDRVDPAVFCITVKNDTGLMKAGSGFFINESGLGVTNYHVIENCTSGEIQLNNGKRYKILKVVGCDEGRDIAIIQIDIKRNKKVKLGDSNKVKVGDVVYSIGYPESFVLGTANSTLTQGIVSKTAYVIDGNTYIQTTADITNGNSGGVLINQQGKVIGITTGQLSDENNNVNYMNMAIPINELSRVKRNRNLTLQEYKDLHVKFYFYVDNYVYKSYDIIQGDKVDSITATKKGYLLDGWFTDKNFEEEFDFSQPINVTTKCYAKWTPITYYIQFDGNGADNTMENQPFKYDERQPLNDNTLIKTGYNFVDWILEKDGDQIHYSNKQSIYNLTSNNDEVIKLIAQWTEKIYTIHFDNGTGQGEMNDIKVKYDETITLPTNEFIKIGYKFVGWQFNDLTFLDCADVKNLTAEEETATLTAIWELISYNVILVKNENDYTDSISYSVKYNETFKLPLETPFDDGEIGYHLQDWILLDDENTTHYSELCMMTTEDGKTFYFKPYWQINKYKVVAKGKGVYGDYSFEKTYNCTYNEPFKVDNAESSFANNYAFKFLGWKYDNGEDVIPIETGENDLTFLNLTTEHNAIININSNWLAIEFKVYVDNNFLTTVTYDDEFTFPDAPTPREHYTFTGWSIYSYSISQWKSIYQPGDVVSNLSDSDDTISIYSRWKGDTYTITYEKGGAETGNMESQQAEFGDIVELKENQFEKDGFMFAGWEYNGKIYWDSFNLGKEYVPNVTLTATWINKLEGQGSELEPYLIKSVEDYNNMAKLINLSKDYSKAYYKLENNLNFESQPYTIIESFSGVFDGNGHEIQNLDYLNYTKTDESVYILALFEDVYSGGTIKNLGITNFSFNKDAEYYQGFATFAIYFRGNMSNCFATGVMNINRYMRVGGLVMSSSAGSSIENCYTDIQATVEDTINANDSYFGGLIGNSLGNVKNCYTNLNLTLSYQGYKYGVEEHKIYIGGLIGKANSGIIENCFAVANMDITIISNLCDYSLSSFSSFANIYEEAEVKNCYVFESQFNCKIDGEDFQVVQNGVTKLEVDNFKNETWVKENVFKDSDLWTYKSGYYPTLKSFEV